MLRFRAASRIVLAAVLCAAVLGPRQSSAADPYELTAIVSLTGVGAFVVSCAWAQAMKSPLTTREVMIRRMG